MCYAKSHERNEIFNKFNVKYTVYANISQIKLGDSDKVTHLKVK